MKHISLTIVIAGICVAVGGGAQAQTAPQPERVTAWAVNMGNIATGTNQSVDFWVDRWSTAQERELLITTMIENGSDALLRALQKMPVAGRMRIPGWQGPDPHNARLGWDVRYAWQEMLPDGTRRVFLAFDRYIGMAEARNQPRTTDYPFTLIEVRLDKSGEGEGKWSIATKINFDKDKRVMELENYGSQPVNLMNVRATPKN